ncbi:MAG: hypothetical protein ACOYEG_08365 [Petrimonas sp.]
MTLKHFFFGIVLLALCVVATSCDEDPISDKKWVTVYQNITLGNQLNYTNGHFLKLKTGESVKLENVTGQEQYMAFLIYTDYGGNCNITFPANAADATAYPTTLKTNRLFVQANVGLNHWDAAKMVNGMIYKTSKMTAADFSKLTSSKDWAQFDAAFRDNNGGNEYMNHLSYALTPSAGNVYLLQFNGVVRAIMCAKSYVVKGDGSSAFTFDIIVESRETNAGLNSAKYLQP